MEWNRSVPHIRGKKDKPSRHGLDGAAHGVAHGDFEGRFSEFYPTLPGRLIQSGIGNRHIVAGTDPACGVNMIDVKAAIMKPRRPGSGKGKSVGTASGQRVILVLVPHPGDIDADRFLDALP